MPHVSDTTRGAGGGRRVAEELPASRDAALRETASFSRHSRAPHRLLLTDKEAMVRLTGISETQIAVLDQGCLPNPG